MINRFKSEMRDYHTLSECIFLFLSFLSLLVAFILFFFSPAVIIVVTPFLFHCTIEHKSLKVLPKLRKMECHMNYLLLNAQLSTLIYGLLTRKPIIILDSFCVNPLPTLTSFHSLSLYHSFSLFL